MKHILLIISLFLLSWTAGVSQGFYFKALTSEDGLSHNSVFSIAEDHKGFMWFGTRDGVSRYDSQRMKTYSFAVHSSGVEANRVTCVYAIGQKLWVGTEVGLFAYLFDTDSFRQVAIGKGQLYVNDIKQMSTGSLWVCTQNGIYIQESQGEIRHILHGQNIRTLCEFRKGTYLVLQDGEPRIINAEGETVISLTIHDGEQEKVASFQNYSIYKDRRGGIWLGTNGGLLLLDEKTMVFRPVDWLTRLIKPTIRVVRTIIEDDAGNLWVGSESGIVVIDRKHQTIQRYDKSYAISPYSLTDRAVYSSCVSRGGTIWLGTYFGGVNYAMPVGKSFNHLYPSLDGKGLSGKAISQLVEDEQQRLWIATEDAGITVLNQKTGQCTYHNRKNGLSDDNVHAIHVDKSGVAWVGTFLGGLNRIDPVSGQKRIYTHKPADSTSISNNFVCTVLRDRSSRLWVGTIRGLNRMDEQTGTFRLVRPDILRTAFIYALLEDNTGQLWIATRFKGIFRYNPDSGKLTNYHVGNTPAMSSNHIISLYEDSAHNIWFGTINGGVGQWDSGLKQVVATPVNRHLPRQTVYGMLEDNQGTFWFSTNSGLLSYNPRQKTYRIFDKSNGLQATQFNFSSYLKDHQGTLYFGGVDGLCFFDPETVNKQVFDPPVYFTDLMLFNKEVAVSEGQLLKKHLDETEELVVEYIQNVITLNFIAINYFSNHTNYYTYYLEGFEKSWGPKTTVNAQTYTNLSPGTYTFHVRAFNSNGDLSARERTIRLRIEPPFWQTTWAYLIYVLLGIGALLLYRYFITFLHNQKVAVQMERVERAQSEELNQQKLNFFTFLSNEFKTPITLIMAEIDELIQSNQVWGANSATNYGVIKKNAKRLSVLIDQITELRQTGSEPQKIQLTDADIISFIKETVHGFDPLIQVRHVRIGLNFSHPYLMASFDARKLEMIVGNVFFYLTNQLAEDEELALDVKIEQLTEKPDCQLVISFSCENQSDLFKMVENSYRTALKNEALFQQNNSAGIGILLTFSLLKVLSGSVLFVDNHQRQGLSIRLPIRRNPVSGLDAGVKKQNLMQSQLSISADDSSVEASNALQSPELVSLKDRPPLLLIDRSKDLVQFLKRHYGEMYRISVANTFAETLKKAESMLPELILCDSDIRDKDNQTLCAALKSNPLTQAIPVILLLNDNEDKTIIEGLKSRADGYISKPFNLNELDLLIDNHLKAVSLLKNKLMGGLADSMLTTLPRRNKEQEFILRFSALVNQHYTNKDISADTLAQHMNCSRSQLHTKLKALTGLSTKEYLNDYRLNLSRQLLANGMSVTETAFEVGFGDPNYFARAFKKKFGTTPSKST